MLLRGRRIPILTGRSIEPETSFDQPLNSDGSVFLKQDYEATTYPGIWLSGSGSRFYVLSAAKGTVLETGTDCIHDQPKTADKDGNLIDPGRYFRLPQTGKYFVKPQK